MKRNILSFNCHPSDISVKMKYLKMTEVAI